jgi:competence protein ComFA
MGAFFICPICGNHDTNKIGIRQNQTYCRACLPFQGETADAPKANPITVETSINYQLSDEQLAVSQAVVACYHRQQSVMVSAVTGSGKTEIVFAVITEALQLGHKVGFVIPRRDVVIELYHRFKKVFPSLHIAALYGGHTSETTADLLVMTTHQIYRYEKYFDLLIFDEVDAFPYHQNHVLEALVKRSVKQVYILLSATFSKAEISAFKKTGGKVLFLFTRYHGLPIPTIDIIHAPFFFQYIVLIYLVKKLLNSKKPFLIFVPTISFGKALARWLLRLFPQGTFIHSQHPHRQTIIEAFVLKKWQFLMTTTILERGITLVDLQVIIMQGDHPLFHERSLVQIAGRVGRKPQAPGGKVYVICHHIHQHILEANARIAFANEHL